jgi:two-component system alkaline phosphatase synthesis response regulator PhoP
LNSAGFEAKGFAEGESFFEALQDQKPDLIMLDVMLPGDDGITILKRLKAQSNTAYVPVIMATAKGTEFDKVIGLDMGADDYLTKPFGMMEMIARIKAVLRRSMPKEGLNVLLAGKLELNLNEHTVTVSGKRVQLTLKEFEMLRLFMEHIGRVYTRDQLLSKIWGADYIGETRTVDVHIGTLRTKLEDCGDYIQTVRGVGYRMEVKP